MEDEECFDDPVVKYQTTGELETCKRAFVNQEFDSFKQQVLSGKFRVHESIYRYSSDYDGLSELAIRNRVSGLCQSLGAHRRYCFVAIKCLKNESQYIFKLYWIVNTDIKNVLKDDYDDYEWSEIDLSNSDDSNYIDFENRFKEETFAFDYVH